jgi:hypothetical protein
MLIVGSIAGCDIVTRAAISGKWKFMPGKKCAKPGLIAEYAKNAEKNSEAQNLLGVLGGFCVERP